MDKYPIKSFSWTLVSEDIAIKKVDKSLIQYQETGIPHDIVDFFPELKRLTTGNEIKLTCYTGGNQVIEIKAKYKNDNRYQLKSLPTPEHLCLENDFLALERDDNGLLHLSWLFAYKPSQDASPSEMIREVKTRRTQSKFRSNTIEVNKSKCLFTGMTDLRLLIASHIKSWADSNDKEKIDGENGLLLSPHYDALFDTHLISFDSSGKILVSNRLDGDVFKAWNINIDKNKVYQLTTKQQKYMKHHREVFKTKDS